MRNAIVQLCLVIIGVLSVHAARLLATSSFHFRIDPAASAEKVEAIQGHDTIQMTRTNGGFYVQWVSPGQWEVVVRASAPYRDYWYDLTVEPGRDIDLGTLRLLRD